MAAGQYFVLCAAGSAGNQADLGSTCNYPYAYNSSSGFTLNNSSPYDSITITCGATIIDSMSYNSVSTGISLSFGLPTGTARNQAYTANDNSANWANSTSSFTYEGTNGSTTDTSDSGTPGTKNDDVLGANAIVLRIMSARTPVVPWAVLPVAVLAVLGGGAILFRRRMTA